MISFHKPLNYFGNLILKYLVSINYLFKRSVMRWTVIRFIAIITSGSVYRSCTHFNFICMWYLFLEVITHPSIILINKIEITKSTICKNRLVIRKLVQRPRNWINEEIGTWNLTSLPWYTWNSWILVEGPVW